MGYDIQVKQPLDEAVEHDSTVQTGTMEDLKGDLDDNILRAQGHEAVLIRQFSWIAALGLGFSITNSWAGYLVRHSRAAAQTSLLLLRLTISRAVSVRISITADLSLASSDSSSPSSPKAP